MQSPTNAPRYRAAGINTYVGLWQGPTAQQLTELHAAGLRVICNQNQTALEHPAATNIIAWSQPDEPDNARSGLARLGFGAPIPPAQICAAYQQMKTRDATRPVFLNLGQGVAWNNWYGRGTRNQHPEDYPQYLAGCDIASFDIYPVNHPDLEIAGNLWYVPQGVTQLREWTHHAKPVWNFIECTGIHRSTGKPSPAQVRAQVWMALIHGAQGIIYFAHQFEPQFIEAALLNDLEMVATVSEINRQIASLAAVLNSSAQTNKVVTESTPAAAPVATMVKQWNGATYLCAVGMRPLETTVTFRINGLGAGETVEVLDEQRTLRSSEGKFSDKFGPWASHIYRLPITSAR